MATQGIAGLFGPMMSQEQLDEQRALQFAQLDPRQQRSLLIGKGAAGVGRSLAGMFGVDVQDPQLKRANRLRQLASQFDINTPEGLRQMASAVQQEDPQASMELARMASQMELEGAQLKTEGAKFKSEEALAAQRMRERQAADPFEKILAAGKYTPESLAKYRQSGNVADLVLTEKEPKISYGAEADRAAKANFGKNFSELTQQQAKVIDDLLEARGVTRAKAGAGKTEVTIPGVKTPGDVVGLRKDIQATTKPYQDQVDAAESALELADLALKDNFVSFSALQRSLAKAAGETQLSARDVDAFGIDPSLVGYVADTVARLASGTPTKDTINKMKQLANALKKKAQANLDAEQEQTLAVARQSGQFTEEQLKIFQRRPSKEPKQKTEFNSIQEAEAANLPKGTVITIKGRRAVVE